MEQFDLLRRYLNARHPGGGMSDMSWLDYVSMVEDTAVRTHLIEYRLPPPDGGPGDLIAVTHAPLSNGDGLNVRDWIHVDDHSSAVLTIIEQGRLGVKSGGGFVDQTINGYTHKNNNNSDVKGLRAVAHDGEAPRRATT